MVANIRGFTPNYNFKLINFDTPRWHTLEYSNWNMADALLLQAGIPEIRGEWANSIHYLIGDRVYDGELGHVYRSLIDHTSSPTGTFANERILHPTYWSLQLPGTPVYRGEWAPGVAYALGDIVSVNNNSGYLCLNGHTSVISAPPPINPTLWQAIYDFSLFSATVLHVAANLSDVQSVATSRDNLGLGSSQTPVFNQVLLNSAPTAANNAITKAYIDARPTIIVSDTPPVGAALNTLWWESDTGTLYLYYFDGDSTQWVQAVRVPSTDFFLLKTGDTMTGPLILSGDPTLPLHATTKQYVDAHASIVASGITFTPAGGIAATNVQAAIVELDAEKLNDAPADGVLYGRKNNVWTVVTTGGGGGSASTTSFVPIGNISSIDVQSAIAELDTEKLAKAGGTMTGALILAADPSTSLQAATKNYVDTHVTGGGGSGSAVTTTFTPAGNIAATNVQTALQELDSEKAKLATISTSAPSGGSDGDVWYYIGGIAYPETIGAGAIPITGQTITPFTGGTTTTVTAPNGMSWTFPGTVTHGTYVNGDVWVFTTTTLPMPTLSTPATGTGAAARNGGMVNPTFNTLVENSPMGNGYTAAATQGFDGRAIENVSNGYQPCMDYSDAYNAHINGSVLHPGDSLISCVSLNDTEYAAITSNKRALWRMACLTVVNYTPFSDEFRPAYFGTTKTRRRFSDLNTALLPNKTAPFNPKGVSSSDWHIDSSSIYIGASSGLPLMTQTEQMRVNSCEDLQYFITPQRSARSTYSLLCPAANMYWYPRDRGTAYGDLACYVLHNFSDRDIFLKRIVQIAIDAYEVAAGFSGAAPFSCGAGFFCTPLWLIRFAGLLFNDTPMKNAVNITTGKVDYWGDTVYKWGEQTRTYFKSGAYSGYRMPTGYTGLVPLWADAPFQDSTAGQPSNGTVRNPTQIYDVYPYREASAQWYGICGGNAADTTHIILDAGVPPTWGDGFFNGCTIAGFIDGGAEEIRTITNYVASTRTCTVSVAFSASPDNNDKFIIYSPGFPNILASTYPQLSDPNSPGVLGSYMSANQFGTMGAFMASVIMGDEAFWGGNGSIQAFNRRYANDQQMWEGWGVSFDYTTNMTSGTGLFLRDIKGFGGAGNGWMCKLWDSISYLTPGSIPLTGANITPVYATHTFGETVTAGAIPITGQTITDVYAPGGSAPVVIFSQTLGANDPGYNSYSVRNSVAITGGAGATSQIRVTFEADSTLAFALNNASVGISVTTDLTDSTNRNCTATPAELTFNTGGHGFSITGAQQKVSDWVTLGGFTAVNLLNITLDFGASNANPRRGMGIPGVSNFYQTASVAQYNVATLPAGGTPISSSVVGVTKIEVK